MKLLHVTIQTNRFQEEIEFYEKEAGLTLQRDLRPMKELVFLANTAGGADPTEQTCVEIIHNPDADDSGNANLSIGFKTDDVVKKHEEMTAAGYQVTPMISPMPGVQFFFVKDPAGMNVQFM